MGHFRGRLPVAGQIESQIRFLIGDAIVAPSGHNTQPWFFRIDGDTVEVRADRTRVLPIVDPDDRSLTISCGAALETLLIAARHFGHPVQAEVLPDKG